MKIKTRFAPKPNRLSARWRRAYSLYSTAFARNHGGEFVLRIEDTDLERSTPEAIEAIMDGMNWLSTGGMKVRTTRPNVLIATMR